MIHIRYDNYDFINIPYLCEAIFFVESIIQKMMELKKM